MFASPREAYETARKTTESPRQLEAAALFKAARLLEECQKGWESPEFGARLDEALRYNQKLWSFFQVELTTGESGLPVDLRRDLLSLSRFIDRRTFDVLSTPTPAKLTALIDINRHIAQGLSGAPA
jgi:flagellar protein FlaF